MSLVEEAYRHAVDTMSPAERIERMVNLSAWGRSLIERRIVEESGPLPPEMLKWKVALWIYGENLESRRLIERALSRVST